MAAPIQPVILSGGAGTRLWPLSRRAEPKQLLPLTGARTLLQQTVDRVADPARFRAPLVVAGAAHRFPLREQLAAAGCTPAAILLEPVARDTAAAVALAALHAAAEDPDALLLVLPSDHWIGDRTAFDAALDRALPAARAGHLVAFGVAPDGPETGYGYIREGAQLPGMDGVFAIDAFTEKPDRATAEAFLAAGGHHWNAGLFLLPAGALLDELDRHAPAILAACRAALAGAAPDLDFLRLDAGALADAPAAPVDRAVMEKTDRGAVVPVAMDWRDLGGFPALRAAAAPDADGNVRVGQTALLDSRNSYVRAEGRRLVAGIGLDGMVVVATADAVLIAPEDRAAEVKALVDTLEAEGRDEALQHTRVHRPWGSYEDVDADDDFLVKRLVVHPGGRLSLQRHARRSEHWIVVRGTAHITVGDTETVLTRNQSTYVPVGETHRLENRGDVPLHLVEVQVGDAPSEDDIERLDDVYGRGEG